MIDVRLSQDRGHAQHGWLDSHHTFSFAEYHDPAQMGWGALRVINEDRVSAGQGFGRHGHRDMEIISYVLDGALEHKDSMGTGSVILPGDVQLMSAGTGVQHSEFNHSAQDPVHFLQIWIVPRAGGLKPNYQENRFGDDEKRGRLRVLVSPDGREGSLVVQQDALLYAALIDGDESVAYTLAPTRRAYIQVVRGSVTVNGIVLSTGDGAKVSAESQLQFTDGQQAEVLLFDLA
jgi:redox-sensitive bicupin YhaK (pirin superfamily)